jgi:hypothetical protein
MTSHEEKSDEQTVREVEISLRKGTEGFLKVLDRLDGISRDDDFKRIK